MRKWLWPYWEKDPDFKPDRHFVEVDKQLSHHDLEKYIADLLSTCMFGANSKACVSCRPC